MDFISVKEASQQLNTSRQWLWFLIKTKQIPAVKVGNSYILDREDVFVYQAMKLSQAVKTVEVSDGK